MPVPKDLTSFFLRLIEKSKKSEINWQATGPPDAFRVTFSGIAILISLEGDKPLVRIQLLNDKGDTAAVISVDQGDDEWLGAMSLNNSANRKVTKKDETLHRAMQELEKEGSVGEDRSQGKFQVKSSKTGLLDSGF